MGFDKSGGSNYAERLKAGEDCTKGYCVRAPNCGAGVIG